MASTIRVRRADEVRNVFETADIHLDEEDSESEKEDHIETQSNNDSEEDADADDEEREMHVDDDGEGILKTRRVLIAVKPSQTEHFRKLSANNGYTWSQIPPQSKSRIRHLAAPKGEALKVTTPLEAWSLLFNDDMLNIIVTCTNKEIDRKVTDIIAAGRCIRTYQKPLDIVELKALIGLLYFIGLQKMNHATAANLWLPYGMSLFRLTMPHHRFSFLMLSLRFDDQATRCIRKLPDRLANIREIWDMFISNCTANYEPHTNVTIDDLFLPFNDKCLFKVSMHTAPNKYGLKIIALNDMSTHYLYNAIPHLGIVHKDPTESIPSYYVRKLTEPIYHTKRNITCKNWYTSVPICEELKNHYGLSMVGAIRKNKPEIPEEFKKISPAGSSQIVHHDGMTLLSVNRKNKKIAIFLSSWDAGNKNDKAPGIPEIVDFYHHTKKGTDSFSKKCRDFTTVRKTRRWPMRYFYSMLDQANVNSLILYTLCENNKKMKRPDFIMDLVLSLVKPLLLKRLASRSLRVSLRVQIDAFMNSKDVVGPQYEHDPLEDNQLPKQKRCEICPWTIDKQTFFKCLVCERPMCKEHTAKICCDCSVEMNQSM